MEKILYVSDLDGTLLNHLDRVSEAACNTINSLVKQGMSFTYATARSFSSASKVAKGLTLNLPLVCYNGAFLVDPKEGKPISSVCFRMEEARYLIDKLNSYSMAPLVYSILKEEQKVSWIKNRENEAMKRYLTLRKGDKRLRPLSTETGLYDGELFYLTCIGEKEKLIKLYEEVKDTGLFQCTLQQELYRTEYWLEIMPKEATKRNGIRKMKELLGYNKVVSFGDAINDIPMFEFSEECYAVENAVNELKKVATDVIKSNEEDGVADWLKEHYIHKESEKSDNS